MLLHTGCTKEEKIATTEHVPIAGKWQLARVTGGMRGVDETPADMGHTQSYEFREGGKCIYIYDGTVAYTTYTLSTGMSYVRDTQANFVAVSEPGLMYEFYFAHDTLILAQDARMDGATEWYVKE